MHCSLCGYKSKCPLAMERHRLSRHVHERRIQSTVSITENHKFNPGLMLPMADLSGLSLNRRNSRQVPHNFPIFFFEIFDRKLIFLVNIGLWIDFAKSNGFIVRNSFNNQLFDYQLIFGYQLIYVQLRMWPRCRCWCWRCGNVGCRCHRCLSRCPKTSFNFESSSSTKRNCRFSNRSTDQSEVSFQMFLKILHLHIICK